MAELHVFSIHGAGRRENRENVSTIDRISNFQNADLHSVTTVVQNNSHVKTKINEKENATKRAITKLIDSGALRRQEYDKLLSALGMEVLQDPVDGKLILSHYAIPNNILLSEFGINETAVFKKVKAISGNAHFSNSEITELVNLEVIGGDVNFYNSKIKTLGKLQVIGGNANFNGCEIKTLRHLKKIGKDMLVSYSKVEDLGDLEEIGGDVNFRGSRISRLKKLRVIKGTVFFSNSEVKKLDKLELIGVDAIFTDSNIKKLGNLKVIGGDAVFSGSNVNDLGNLQQITFSVFIRNSRFIQSDFKDIQYGEFGLSKSVK